jgi:hypothetical protein
VAVRQSLANNEILPSTGSVGDSYDNALMESTTGSTRPNASSPKDRSGPGFKPSTPPRSGSTGTTTTGPTAPWVTGRVRAGSLPPTPGRAPTGAGPQITTGPKPVMLQAADCQRPGDSAQRVGGKTFTQPEPTSRGQVRRPEANQGFQKDASLASSCRAQLDREGSAISNEAATATHRVPCRVFATGRGPPIATSSPHQPTQGRHTTQTSAGLSLTGLTEPNLDKGKHNVKQQQ